MANTLRSGTVAAESGCHAETIRYYERIGLLPRPRRSGSGRAYSTSDVARLHFVVRCRDLGFSLDEIRSLMALDENPKLSCSKVDALRHLEEIQAKQDALAALSWELQRLIDTCAQGRRRTCEILAALHRPTMPCAEPTGAGHD